MYLRLGLVEVGGVVMSVILWLVSKDLHSDHGLSVRLGRSELNLPIRTLPVARQLRKFCYI